MAFCYVYILIDFDFLFLVRLLFILSGH